MMEGFLQLCLTEHRVSWYGGASNMAEPCFTVHFFEIYHNISWKISSSIHSHYSHLKSNGVSPAFPLCTCSGCPQKDGTLKIMLSPFPKLQQFFLKYLVYSHYSLYLYSYLYILYISIHICLYLFLSIPYTFDPNLGDHNQPKAPEPLLGQDHTQPSLRILLWLWILRMRPLSHRIPIGFP
jgi:hypothetical protein